MGQRWQAVLVQHGCAGPVAHHAAVAGPGRANSDAPPQGAPCELQLSAASVAGMHVRSATLRPPSNALECDSHT